MESLIRLAEVRKGGSQGTGHFSRVLKVREVGMWGGWYFRQARRWKHSISSMYHWKLEWKMEGVDMGPQGT